MNHQKQSTLIHIGYVKTGSTWMQSELIWNNQFGYHSAVSRRDLSYAALKQPEWGDDRCEIFARVTEAGINRAIELGLTPVISHECLSGNPLQGGYLAPTNLHVLSRCFPDAKILICIREQKSLIKSYYHEYINQGGVLRISEWVNPPEGHGRLPLFVESYLHYTNLVQAYIKKFGRANVMIEPFERFRSDIRSFAQRLGRFVGRSESLNGLNVAPERVSKPPCQIFLERYYNRILYYNRINPGGFLHVPRARKYLALSNCVIPKAIQNRLSKRETDWITQWSQGRFGESNRKLSDIIGIELKDYGYDCN